MNDVKRVDYFNSYLTAIHTAINRDGCNIKGYIAWSLMDSFEWKAGFTEKFGLYHVDFNHPNRTRTPKRSAFIYSQIAKTKQIDKNYQPPKVFMDSLNESSSSSIIKVSNICILILGMKFIYKLLW